MFPTTAQIAYYKRLNLPPFIISSLRGCYFPAQYWYVFASVVVVPVLIMFHLPGLPGTASLDQLALHRFSDKNVDVAVFQYSVCMKPYTVPQTGVTVDRYCGTPSIGFVFDFEARLGPSSGPPSQKTRYDPDKDWPYAGRSDAELLTLYKRNLAVWKMVIWLQIIFVAATDAIAIAGSYLASRKMAYSFMCSMWLTTGMLNVFMFGGYFLFANTAVLMFEEAGVRRNLAVTSSYSTYWLYGALLTVLPLDLICVGVFFAAMFP